MVSGFGIEAIADTEDLATFLASSLDWLDSTDADEPNIPVPSGIISSVSPVPARRRIDLSLNVGADERVTVTLNDLNGHRVATIHEDVWHGTTLNLPNLAAGSYVIAVSTKSIVGYRPIVILGD